MASGFTYRCCTDFMLSLHKSRQRRNCGFLSQTEKSGNQMHFIICVQGSSLSLCELWRFRIQLVFVD